MDEILVNNFMVLNDVVEDGEYDLVIGDEAWTSITTCTSGDRGRRSPG
jgi:hypothetical protein